MGTEILDDVLERRYLGVVDLARRAAEARDFKQLARAISESLETALVQETASAPAVRVWATGAEGAEELSRHPRDHEFERVSQHDLQQAGEVPDPVATDDGAILAALHSGGTTLGVLEVRHPGVDADLVGHATPIVAGRFSFLAGAGVAGVLPAPRPDESCDDAAALMSTFAAEAKRQLEHDRLSAYLLTAEGRAFERFAVTTSPIVPGEGVIIPFEDVGLRHVVVTNRALVSADLASDPRIVGREDRVVARGGFHGLISVPLRLHGRPIGVLNFVSRTPGFYTAGDVPIAQQIADQIAAFVGHLHGQQRLRTLIRHEAAETERARVARDLYHAVGQTVPAIERAGRELADRLGDADPVAAAAAERMAHLAREALADVRRAVTDLVPRGLDAHTLEDAMRAALDPPADGDPRWQLRVDGDTRTLSGAVRRGAFRIFQEALTNVRLHAGARNVEIRLRCGRDLLLTVQDDGVGFDPGSAGRSPGLGLQFMTDRALALGGVLTVRSAHGSGTLVRFELLEARHAAHWTEPPDAAEPAGTPTGAIRVFVADRHPLVRRGLERLVEQAPNLRLVGEAGRIEELRAQLRRLHPDVLLLDASLAQADDDALLHEVRTELPEMATIVLSDSATGREAALDEAGVAGVLLKLSDPAELVEAIRAVAAGAKVRPSDPGPGGTMVRLTERERSILALMVAGRTNAEIGKTLYLATKTVERQLATTVRKLGARNRAHATALAVARHLVEPPEA